MTKRQLEKEPEWILKHMIKALSSLRALNNEEEENDLKLAKLELELRRKQKRHLAKAA